MTISEYRAKLRELTGDLQDETRLRNRIERLFPGVEVKITIDNESGKHLISGLTPDQMTQLLRDGLG